MASSTSFLSTSTRVLPWYFCLFVCNNNVNPGLINRPWVYQFWWYHFSRKPSLGGYTLSINQGFANPRITLVQVTNTLLVSIDIINNRNTEKSNRYYVKIDHRFVCNIDHHYLVKLLHLVL